MGGTDPTKTLRTREVAAATIDPDTVVVVQRGTVLGRYTVVSHLGAGGAGSVYTAYDSHLDRRVALKVLHLGSGSSRGWQRIVREARILAKLQHPNVVTLHDVDEVDGVAFIAMEYVRGEDLASWGSTHRSWQQVVDVFEQAARGLAAAHAAGIIHGDVKPANVLMGDDGRVRVSDFGVARFEAGSGSATIDDDEPEVAARIIGTPYYMAPEQHDGATPDVRSDVFSLCVSMYELLYGERPFRAVSMEGLASEKAEGPPTPKTDRASAPRWLRELLAKGMAPAPEHRIPDVRTLLAGLDRRRVHRRRRAVAFASVGLFGIGAAAYASYREPCTGADERMAEVWNDTRRSEVRTALAKADRPYTESITTTFEQGLDDYARAWVDAHREACLASVRGEQSDRLLDRRMQCLEDRRTRVRALLELLRGPIEDAELLRVPESVASLAPLDVCGDLERMMAGPEIPDDPRAADVRAALDRSAAAGSLGRFEDARRAATEAREIAERIGSEPLIAAALLELGSVHAFLGEAETAEELLSEAHFMAERSGDDAAAANAGRWLVWVVGDMLRRDADALLWARQAEASTVRAGDHPLDRAQLWTNLGLLHTNAARLDEAEKAHNASLQLRLEALGPDATDIAIDLNALGTIALQRGDYEAANRHFLRALELKRKRFGDEHPSLGITWSNLGVVARRMGRYDEAFARYDAARRLWEATLGPDHPHLGIAHTNLGNIAAARGDHRAAKEAHARACAIWKAAYEADHPDIGLCTTNLAEAELRLGNLAIARELATAALQVRERRLGAEHPDVAFTDMVLGEIELREGNPTAALARFEAAYAIWDRPAAEDDQGRASALVGRGLALLALDRSTEATPLLERAVELCTAMGAEPRLLGQAQFALAKALVALDPTVGGGPAARTRALSLARSARTAFAGIEDEHTSELEAWLGEHER